MISLFIFYLHTVAVAAIYTKRWQESQWKEGLLAVVFFVLFFSVGWSIATVIVKPLIGEKGFGVWLDRDTLSLVLLSVLEGVFYTAQLRSKKRRLTRPAS